MNRTVFIMVASLAAVCALFLLLMDNDAASKPGTTSDQPVMLHCAASNYAVLEAIAAEYEAEYGRKVQIQSGPSQSLLSSIEVSGAGELFLPADDSFLQIGRDKNLISEILPIARMQGVIAVRRGNPKQIKSFNDLLRDDVQLVQANTDASAIGKLTRKILKATGQWEELDQATDAYLGTVTDVAKDLSVGAADAGIVYDAVLHPYPDLEFVELDEFRQLDSQVSIGVISTSRLPTAALHFARYVSAHDRGQKHYAEHGYRTSPGDGWADVPELSVFAGSMLRPAIDETITKFEQREGIRVTRVYNGCGILVAQMQAGQQPDAYFACDTEFMAAVPDLFPHPIDVSQNELVILVQKGNPEDIRTLRDLSREGLTVGVGHEKQCAMGWLTKNTLQEGGVYEEVMANVTVQTPTGDMLVNQLQTGSLDAAIVYLSNAAGAGEDLEAIRIEGIQCAVATQPLAISQKTIYPHLTGRLFERLQSTESRKDFLAEGFRWNAD